MPDAVRTLAEVPATPWMKALAPAMRFVLHGDAQVRAAAAPIWGVDCAEEACRAGVQGSRAALWLGPDEYLLIGSDEFSCAWHGRRIAVNYKPGGLADGDLVSLEVH